MLEKLDIDITQSVATNHCIINKVNEIIDVVNVLVKENNIHEKQIDELQMRTEMLERRVKALDDPTSPTYTDTDLFEQPVDKFAEQKRWIGKLCKFWDDSEKPENYAYGVLCNVFDLYQEDCPFQCENGEWYEHCEPVKPDDSIIYKGE